MAKDIEQTSLRDFKKRKKRLKRRIMILVFLLLIAVAAVGVVLLIKKMNKVYHNIEVVHTFANKSEGLSGYLSYGQAVVKYSRDGAEAINKDGSLKWNGSYTMKDPIAAVCGKYVAIADRGANQVYIFNEKGPVGGSIDSIDKIVKVEVAMQGVVAVLLEGKDAYSIKLFDKEGSLLVNRKLSTDKMTYPIDIALSGDGKKLVVSYLAMNTGKLESSVVFYNFGEYGQNKTDRFIGGQKYPDTIVPEVDFMDNNTVCVYMENGFELYSYREEPEQIKQETFKRNIKSVFHNEKYTGIILEGIEGEQAKQLLLYNKKGKKVLSKEITLDYKQVMLSGDEVILNNEQACLIMKANGKIKLRYSFDNPITAVFPIDNLDHYYTLNNDTISEIKLVD